MAKSNAAAQVHKGSTMAAFCSFPENAVASLEHWGQNGLIVTTSQPGEQNLALRNHAIGDLACNQIN